MNLNFTICTVPKCEERLWNFEIMTMFWFHLISKKVFECERSAPLLAFLTSILAKVITTLWNKLKWNLKWWPRYHGKTWISNPFSVSLEDDFCTKLQKLGYTWKKCIVQLLNVGLYDIYFLFDREYLIDLLKKPLEVKWLEMKIDLNHSFKISYP